MTFNSIKFSSHTIKRMFERKISKADIIHILNNGKIIKEYPDDKPYPSFLMLGFIEKRPLHIIVAYEKKQEICYIITVYEPDFSLWNDSFIERRDK